MECCTRCSRILSRVSWTRYSTRDRRASGREPSSCDTPFPWKQSLFQPALQWLQICRIQLYYQTTVCACPHKGVAVTGFTSTWLDRQENINLFQILLDMSQNARQIRHYFKQVLTVHSPIVGWSTQTHHVLISSAVYSTRGIRSPLKVQHQNSAHLIRDFDTSLRSICIWNSFRSSNCAIFTYKICVFAFVFIFCDNNPWLRGLDAKPAITILSAVKVVMH